VRIDGRALVASDVALMMAAMKLARLRFNPTHEDSWVDLAGYAACGMDVAFKPSNEDAFKPPLRVVPEISNGGWVGDMYRCGDEEGLAEWQGRIGAKPHAAHSYGRDNGQWCDGYD